MPIKTNTREELEAIARGAISAFIDGADTSEGSDYDISARMNASVAHAAQRSAVHAAAQIFPKGADADFLILHAQERGTSKIPAAKARGIVLLTATGGTPAQTLGSTLSAADGSQFITTSSDACSIALWIGKTTGDGCTASRIMVRASTAGMVAGDIVKINGESRPIKEVLTSIGAIDLDGPPLTQAPAAGVTISADLGSVVSIEAVVAGSASNKEQGSTLTLAAPVSLMNAAALVLNCSGGGEEETDAELASRLMDMMANPPGSGNLGQIREVARTTPGIRIADAVVYAGLRGLGTVDVIPIGLSGARLAGQWVCDAIAAQLASVMPPVLVGGLLVGPFTYTSTAYNVTLGVVTEPGRGPDWSGSFQPQDASTKSHVILSTDPRATLSPGMRVVFRMKRGWRYRSYVRTLVGVGWDGALGYVDIDKELPDAPASTDPTMLPGSPLAEDVIAAFEATFDELGPSAYQVSGGQIVYERFPSPGVAWLDRLLPGSFSKHVLVLDGVLDLTVGGVTSTVQPDVQQVATPGLLTMTFTEA